MSDVDVNENDPLDFLRTPVPSAPEPDTGRSRGGFGAPIEQLLAWRAARRQRQDEEWSARRVAVLAREEPPLPVVMADLTPCSPQEQAEQDERALQDWQHTCRAVVAGARRDAERLRRQIRSDLLAGVFGRQGGPTPRAVLQAELDEELRLLEVWEPRLRAAHEEQESAASEDAEIAARLARYAALSTTD